MYIDIRKCMFLSQTNAHLIQTVIYIPERFCCRWKICRYSWFIQYLCSTHDLQYTYDSVCLYLSGFLWLELMSAFSPRKDKIWLISIIYITRDAAIWTLSPQDSVLTIDILETKSSPHNGTAIADITSKMITEMTYRW